MSLRPVEISLTRDRRREAEKRITTARTRYHTALDLSELELVAVPPSVFPYEKLTRLDLSNNELESLPGTMRGAGPCCFGTKATGIARLTALTELRLSNNRLSVLPAGIGALKQLTILDVQRNELTSLPAEIGMLKNLKSPLKLHKNQLTKLPPEFAELTQLSEVWLEDNEFEELPLVLGGMKLERIMAANNHISNVSTEFGVCTQLAALDVVGNRLMFLPPEVLGLPNLVHLWVANNPMAKAIEEKWSKTEPPTADVPKGLKSTPTSRKQYYQTVQGKGFLTTRKHLGPSKLPSGVPRAQFLSEALDRGAFWEASDESEGGSASSESEAEAGGADSPAGGVGVVAVERVKVYSEEDSITTEESEDDERKPMRKQGKASKSSSPSSPKKNNSRDGSTDDLFEPMSPRTKDKQRLQEFLAREAQREKAVIVASRERHKSDSGSGEVSTSSSSSSLVSSSSSVSEAEPERVETLRLREQKRLAAKNRLRNVTISERSNKPNSNKPGSERASQKPGSERSHKPGNSRKPDAGPKSILKKSGPRLGSEKKSLRWNPQLDDMSRSDDGIFDDPAKPSKAQKRLNFLSRNRRVSGARQESESSSGSGSGSLSSGDDKPIDAGPMSSSALAGKPYSPGVYSPLPNGDGRGGKRPIPISPLTPSPVVRRSTSSPVPSRVSVGNGTSTMGSMTRSSPAPIPAIHDGRRSSPITQAYGVGQRVATPPLPSVSNRTRQPPPRARTGSPSTPQRAGPAAAVVADSRLSNAGNTPPRRTLRRRLSWEENRSPWPGADDGGARDDDNEDDAQNAPLRRSNSFTDLDHAREMYDMETIDNENDLLFGSRRQRYADGDDFENDSRPQRVWKGRDGDSDE